MEEEWKIMWKKNRMRERMKERDKEKIGNKKKIMIEG